MLGVLTGWRGYAAAALAGGMVLGAAAWTVRGWRGDAALARSEANHATVMEEHARAALAAVDAARTEEQRRAAALEDARNDALEKAAAAADDAATAHAAGQRLRARIDALVADAGRRDPALAAGGPAAGDSIDMLAHVLGRAIDAAGQLATYADRARIAGLTCERAYDSLFETEAPISRMR